jgi:DNA-directed RNA polymerase subunit RPC12/RpoP
LPDWQAYSQFPINYPITRLPDYQMQVLVRCPKCDAALPVEAASAPAAIKCGRCGSEISLAVSEALQADSGVDSCPVCRGSDFYIRKDFDPKVGLAFVLTGAFISAVFYWFRYDFIAYGILAAAALIDLVAYRRLKDVTVCYRCHAEFRGAYPRTASAFDLHTADVLEQEYERRIGRR